MLPFSGGSELLGVSVAIEGVKNWNTSAGGGALEGLERGQQGGRGGRRGGGSCCLR